MGDPTIGHRVVIDAAAKVLDTPCAGAAPLAAAYRRRTRLNPCHKRPKEWVRSIDAQQSGVVATKTAVIVAGLRRRPENPRGPRLWPLNSTRNERCQQTECRV